MNKIGLGAPVGGDDGQSAGHRFEYWQPPALAARREHETVRRAVERSELVCRHHLVNREDDPPATLLQPELPHFAGNIDQGVLVIDFADEDGLIVRAELVVERLEQHLGCLPLSPLERGEESEDAGHGIAFDLWIEVRRVHAEGHDVDGSFDAARPEGAGVE